MSESVAEAGGYKECVLQITGDRQVALEFECTISGGGCL